MAHHRLAVLCHVEVIGGERLFRKLEGRLGKAMPAPPLRLEKLGYSDIDRAWKGQRIDGPHAVCLSLAFLDRVTADRNLVLVNDLDARFVRDENSTEDYYLHFFALRDA